MTDQIFILVIAIMLSFAFGCWIGRDSAVRELRRKRYQKEIDEWQRP
jgi:hypothetical protein